MRGAGHSRLPKRPRESGRFVPTTPGKVTGSSSIEGVRNWMSYSKRCRSRQSLWIGGDSKERVLWPKYQHVFEEAINAAGAKEAPWYVILADDKKRPGF